MKIIDIEQYGLQLKVFTSINSLKRYCKKSSYLIEDDLSSIQAYALHYQVQGHDLLMFVPKEYSEELVDHELIHITWYIARIVGLPLTYNNQEFQTYLFTDLKKKVKKKVYRL
jgi:hypothetical protein